MSGIFHYLSSLLWIYLKKILKLSARLHFFNKIHAFRYLVRDVAFFNTIFGRPIHSFTFIIEFVVILCMFMSHNESTWAHLIYHHLNNLKTFNMSNRKLQRYAFCRIFFKIFVFISKLHAAIVAIAKHLVECHEIPALFWFIMTTNIKWYSVNNKSQLITDWILI